MLKIPEAPKSIQKGVPLKLLLDNEAITQLAQNINIVYPTFDKSCFTKETCLNIEDLSLKERSSHIAKSLKEFLPSIYSEAIEILLKSSRFLPKSLTFCFFLRAKSLFFHLRRWQKQSTC